MLQIRRGNRNNLEIILHISPYNIPVPCDSLIRTLAVMVLMRGHNMFYFPNKIVSLNYPQYDPISGALITCQVGPYQGYSVCGRISVTIFRVIIAEI